MLGKAVSGLSVPHWQAAAALPEVLRAPVALLKKPQKASGTSLPSLEGAFLLMMGVVLKCLPVVLDKWGMRSRSSSSPLELRSLNIELSAPPNIPAHWTLSLYHEPQPEHCHERHCSGLGRRHSVASESHTSSSSLVTPSF